MKKIILIIFMFVSIVSISACSKDKTELEIFLNNINNSNYVVSYKKVTTNEFHVSKNLVKLTKETLNTGNVNARNDYYDFTKNKEGFYDGGTKYSYNSTINNIEMFDKFSINKHNMLNDVEEATLSPFMQVTTWLDEKDINKDHFKLDNNIYFYVNPSYGKKEASNVNVDNSYITIKFNYENDSLVTVEVVAKEFGTWIFSNFNEVELSKPNESQIRK